MNSVDKEISTMEMNSKVRDLEIMMIDFKANIERRIQRHIEENPQKYLQQFKSLESQEMQMWKTMNDKQTILQETVQQVKIQSDRNRDQLTQMVLELSKKLSDAELRMNAPKSSSDAVEKYIPQQNVVVNNDLDIRLIRDTMSTEKAYREGLISDMQRQYQEMHQRLIKQEAEFFNKLKQQRDEFIEQNERTKQQLKGLDNIKLQKINQDQDYLKNMIGSVEGRIADEVEKRLKSEFEQRGILEGKLQALREEVKASDREILMNEQKFMGTMHESVSSLNQIIKNIKEQLEANLAASQTLTAENLRSLSKTVDIIKEGTMTKVSLIEHGQRELNQRIQDTKLQLHEHQQLVEHKLNEEQQKHEKLHTQIEEQLAKEAKNLQSILEEERNVNEEWKKTFTNKNIAIFSEISTTFKSIKGDSTRDRTDLQDKLNLLRQELNDTDQRLSGLVSNQERAVKSIQEDFTFKHEQAKQETQEAIHNTIIKLQTETLNSYSKAVQEARETAKVLVLDATDQINVRITNELELQEELTDIKLKQAQISMKTHVEERENFIISKLDSLIEKKKEQREKLQQLIEQYSQMMQRLKEHLESEIQSMKSEINSRIDNAVQVLQAEIKDKLAEQFRYFQQEILNIDLKLNAKLDTISGQLMKQIDSIKEYMTNLDKSIKSWVTQELEQTKFELKLIMKEIENDMFRLKVWLMQQVEIMNQSMQEIHIQIQSELYMDRMYQTAIFEQFQDHSHEQMNLMNNLRLQWQENMMNKFDSLENRMTEQYHLLQAQMIKEISELDEKLSKDIGDLENKLQAQLIETTDQLTQKMQAQREDLERQLNELEQKTEQELTNLRNSYQSDIKEMRMQIQAALTSICETLTHRTDDLRAQIEQVHMYFESRLFADNILRQASETLEKERHNGIVGKLNLLVKEMERLEEKKNQIKAELNDVIKGVGENFKVIQQALVDHQQFLNEVDSQLTLQILFSKAQSQMGSVEINDLRTRLSTTEGSLSTARIDIAQLKDTDKDLEEKIEGYNTTAVNQLAQIQEDQDEINSNQESSIKYLQVSIQKHEGTLDLIQKTIDEEVKPQIQENIQNISSLQELQEEDRSSMKLIHNKTGAMEENLKQYIDSQDQLTLQLIKDNFKLTQQNLSTVEQNFQITMQENQDQLVAKIEQTQQATALVPRIDELEETNRKLILDTNKLASEIQENFGQVADKINLLKAEQSSLAAKVGQDTGKKANNPELQQDLNNYGLALEDLRKDIQKELDRHQSQIDSLSQSSAQYQQPQKGDSNKNLPQGEVTKQEFNQVKNSLAALQNQVNAMSKPGSQSQVAGQQMSNIEIQQFNDRLNGLEKDIEAQFGEQDQKISALEQAQQKQMADIRKLGTGGGGQQTPAQKNQSDADVKKLQNEIALLQEDLGKELDRIDAEIVALQQQKPASGAAQAPTKEISQIKAAQAQFEQDVQAEFEDLRREMTELSKSQPAGKAQAPADQDTKKYVDSQIANINKQIEELKAQKGGAQPPAKQAPPAANADTAALKTQITKLEGEIDKLNKDLDEVFERLEQLEK